MKWLLLGAIGGSALTVAVMTQRRQGPADPPTPIVTPEAADPTKLADARTSVPVANPPGEPATAATAASPAARGKHTAPGRAHALQSQTDLGDSGNESARAFAADSSTLAAEVSRIDSARTANTEGDYDEAILLVERYHRDFPNGALAPDADVVALEAVAAKRDRAEIARRAALFLSRYPGDPHAARVKWLAAH